MRRAWLLGFVAVVVAANALTAWLGVVDWLGITATAGTWLAGFAFVARDGLDDAAGRWWVLTAIGVGAVVSAVFAPQLAVASCAAFIVSELADWAVYAPLRSRHRTVAAVLSNTAGALVDSVVFLLAAGFPLALLPGQVVVKVGTTTAFIGVSRVVFRKPILAGD